MLERADKPTGIPSSWEELELPALRGTTMIIGPSDVGKSTFARYIFKRLCKIYPRVGYFRWETPHTLLPRTHYL